MILPIFLTNRYLSVIHGNNSRLVRIVPTIDPFTPLISTIIVREILKDAYPKIELESDDFNPSIVSIASDTYDIDTTHNIDELLKQIPFPIIIPEIYYSRAVDMITPAAANEFLNCQKYGFDIPEDIKIQIDAVAISIYIKENIGKFISQSDIVICSADLDPKFIDEYTEAVVKALADGVQVAGVWNIFIDSEYSLIPKLIKATDEDTALEDVMAEYLDIPNGKLIIAPGVKSIEVGEDDNFETVEVTDANLNKFKIKADDKVVFKWKSDKSKFEGEIYGSKTGIRIDVRPRA